MKRFFLLLALALPVFVIPLQGGCNGQSEGQRCDYLNVDANQKNLDCQDGLTCTKIGGFSFCCSDNSAHPACVGSNTTSSTGTGMGTSTGTTTSSTTGTGTGGGGGSGGGTATGTGGGSTGGADGGTDDAGDAG